MPTYNPGSQFTPNSGYGTRVDPKNPTRTEFHPGQDYAAPAGTPIPAASSGTVVFSGYNSGGYGNTVIIRSEGPNGTYYTLYSHQNGQDLPQVGDTVNQGDTIGHVGSTGRSTGNHLHFEVLDGDAPIRSGEGGPIGVRSSDESVRSDPETFDNWGDGGSPYGAESGNNSPFPPPNDSGFAPGFGPFTDPGSWTGGGPGDADGDGIPDIHHPPGKSPIDKARKDFGTGELVTSPIILDLDGDGVETTSVNTWAYFDHDGNGFAESTGWVGRDDGLLVRDLDGNGRIDSGKELFGNNTLLANGTAAANGFEALKQLDSNLDGKVDSNDAAFASLKVWKDTDGDGYTSAGELLTLEQAGVQSINTGYSNGTVTDLYGNAHAQVGSYTKVDGTTAKATDVWFKTDKMNTIAEEWLAVPDDIAALPDLQGLGNVRSLQQAMVRDGTGSLKALVQQFASATGKTARQQLLDQIVFKWAGTENDILRGGYYMDGRRLATLEVFFNESYVSVSGAATPGKYASGYLNRSYDTLTQYFYSLLTAQTALKPFYEKIAYRWDEQSQTMRLDLSASAILLADSITSNRALGKEQLEEFVYTLETLGVENAVDALPFCHSLESLGSDIAAIITGVWNMQEGTAGNDTITANVEKEIIYGMSGDDTLKDYGNGTLDGGAGNDTLYGGFGNSIVYGGEGDDTVRYRYFGNTTIYAGDGNDLIQADSLTGAASGNYQNVNTMSGGRGNDRFVSGGSADTYVFNRGDGQDVINDNAANANSGADKLVLGIGITAQDLSAVRVGNNLVLTINNPDDPAAIDSITIENWSNSSYRVEQVSFADGTLWSGRQLSDLVMAATFTEGADVISLWADPLNVDGKGGDDIIAAGASSVSIHGGSGNDSITGGAGDDILHGDEGNDTISDSGGSNIIYGNAGNDTISLTSVGRINHDVIDGGEGNDIITDADGNETIYGGTGNDTITDNAGNDTIDGGAGDDIITDQGGGTNVLRGGYGNDSITFSYSANNTVEGGAGDDLIKVDAYNGYGASFSNTFAGGAGADRLQGGVGADTYLYNRGDGADTINDCDWGTYIDSRGRTKYQSFGKTDTIVFGSGINTSDVKAIRSGNHLVVSIADPANPEAADSITIENWSDSRYRIEQFKFADGTVWDAAAVNVRVAMQVGSSGNDVLSGMGDNGILQGLAGVDSLTDTTGNNLIDGGADADTLIAGTGNDLLAGGSGNDSITTGAGYDVIVFNTGDGLDVVNASAGADNTLSLGGGISYADLSLSKSGNDLTLKTGSTDQITFKDWYASTANRSVLNLQVIAEAMADFDAGGSEVLKDNKVETFDFAGLTDRFDQALAADGTLTSWALTDALMDFHLSGSDVDAIGGDLAYQYGKAGTLAGLGLNAAQSVISAPTFGQSAQALHAASAWQSESVKLG